VEAGELVTLLGANGAGKSSIFMAISGLLAPTEGEVLFEGKPIHRAGPEAIARLGISHVPEGRRIFPGLTVRENILLCASNRKGVPRRQLETEADEKFEIFPEIRRFENALGWTLSGGQQQMLAVARGLMAQPKLLLLDEVMAGLRPTETDEMVAAFRRLNASSGITILLIEHVMRSVMALAGRVHVLHHGATISEGPPEAVTRDPAVVSSYLGTEALA